MVRATARVGPAMVGATARVGKVTAPASALRHLATPLRLAIPNNRGGERIELASALPSPSKGEGPGRRGEQVSRSPPPRRGGRGNGGWGQWQGLAYRAWRASLILAS